MMTPKPVHILVALVLGVALGLLYGWLVQPVTYVETAPDSLREDYRTDYVLMVAEAYSGPQSLDATERRLASLGPEPPLDIVQRAQVYARQNNFSQDDLGQLSTLAKALESVPSAPEIGGP
jgi:hypothetical protein